MGLALIILAAGRGTRMKSDLPKVLHRIAGAPMLVHAMKAGETLAPDETVIVAGYGAEAVGAAARDRAPDARIVLQTEQRGTAHAVAQAAPALDGFDGDVIVLFGDTPFISAETLARMAEARLHHDIVVLGFEAADPARYGRLVMHGDNLERIVEFKDARATERAIGFCNSGVMAAPAALLFDLVAEVTDDNAGGEFYLTDIVAIARARGLSATAVACDEAETLGINSRTDLAAAEAAFQDRARTMAMDAGVTLVNPNSVHFSHDTVIGRDTVVEPNVVFGPGVTVAEGVQLRAFSHLEGCHVGSGAIVGPYARLRPGTDLGEEARIGNFVETKNATIGTGTKINHLSYIGDATLGSGANIGAGTITCNYDGVMKHHTEIGARAFIGSDTMLVAPVSVGDDAMTGSGSVITRDVPGGALALSRPAQENKPGMARKLLELLKKKKSQRDRGDG
ncbi:bifunctional UDP-N-acetylglucosamine diphosphorylase/glucosamine-1-phosphate N-acetyltransferase GlmU [Roseovarius sp. TE539]|uniref:bifunctional UDP-N-acetylglucosamine diphosphorylase/glucosamine-1-phosphate N-acetyltransferase GlmU n=1 Tax=Roseovarius sp. TE539 TaxID=2249812 RepID=UPI000DDF1CD9|nr:bifunctional UDP-N-acetylglucosamine diphosphorylase/glucosamine-1-phosphate N-acetyltransferase GlmU [Roseovarius sp. TE539]RBI75245.1 bifunctional UDP-N-acetylglucosamine diphosphorylase/glucosamine-1-phosphate N-acetyltransferase GlmU [Roseovarius sp. TE539]